MERIRRFNSACYSFGRSVVEWRSPATAPYLMAINSAFWAASLYTDAQIQQRLLISIAAGVFGWDVLLSPTHERSIATHVLVWPVQSLWRTLGVALSLYSTHMLRIDLLQHAFWTAYASLACLLVNPVWDYYETNQKIARGASYSWNQTLLFCNAAFVRPFFAFCRAIKYVVCLEFIHPMWTAIRQAFSSTGGGIRGLWRAFCSWLAAGWATIASWWRNAIVAPIWRGLCAVGRFLRYWFCAHWWPGLKEWLKVKFGRPLQRLFNYICYCMVYVFCGHWVKPLGRFLWKHISRLGSFLHRTVVVPTKLWLVARANDLSVLVRRLLHRAAVAIRDSILWPICLLIADAAKELYAVVHRTCIQPILDYLYVRYKVVEDHAYIYVLGPVCNTYINNIPEKSPFCDDSDVELEDLLPDEISDEDDAMATNDERPSTGTTAFAEGAEMDIEEEDDDLLPPGSPLDEEEHDFVSGLAFPTIHASESSDAEFDLNTNQRRVVRRTKKRPMNGSDEGSDGDGDRRRQPPPEKELEEDDLLPVRRSPRGRQRDNDDLFEILE